MRRLTKDEKRLAQDWWPDMDVDNVWVTGEATGRYNCLAWSLGIDSRWIWPWGSREPTEHESDEFMRGQGFRPGGGEIAVLGSVHNMKHYCVAGPGPGLDWESKCGRWLRILHSLKGIEGGIYGSTQGFYTGGEVFAAPPKPDPAPKRAETEAMPEILSDADLAFLDTRVNSVSRELGQAFDERYVLWKATWTKPHIAISSCPSDYAKSKEFGALIALGKDILPLLMNRLRDPDEFLALQAVELFAAQELFIERDLDDPAILDGEQRRAQEVVKRWIAKER